MRKYQYYLVCRGRIIASDHIEESDDTGAIRAISVAIHLFTSRHSTMPDDLTIELEDDAGAKVAMIKVTDKGISRPTLRRAGTVSKATKARRSIKVVSLK